MDTLCNISHKCVQISAHLKYLEQPVLNDLSGCQRLIMTLLHLKQFSASFYMAIVNENGIEHYHLWAGTLQP